MPRRKNSKQRWWLAESHCPRGMNAVAPAHPGHPAHERMGRWSHLHRARLEAAIKEKTAEVERRAEEERLRREELAAQAAKRAAERAEAHERVGADENGNERVDADEHERNRECFLTLTSL